MSSGKVAITASRRMLFKVLVTGRRVSWPAFWADLTKSTRQKSVLRRYGLHDHLVHGLFHRGRYSRLVGMMDDIL